MAATFSWAQATGAGEDYTLLGSSGLLWAFKTSDDEGLTNSAANPIDAGKASYPVWIRGWWTTDAAHTFTNCKFWNYDPYTASFTVFGTTQTAYSQATSTATGSQYASNVAVPTSSSSTASEETPLDPGGTTLGANASGYSSRYICLQMSVASDAPAGDTPTTGWTFQYDQN